MSKTSVIYAVRQPTIVNKASTNSKAVNKAVKANQDAYLCPAIATVSKHSLATAKVKIPLSAYNNDNFLLN